jgi:hypothetical protein
MHAIHKNMEGEHAIKSKMEISARVQATSPWTPMVHYKQTLMHQYT